MKDMKFLCALVVASFMMVFSTQAQNIVLEKNGIKLTPVTDSPLFPDATLDMIFPVDGEETLNKKDSAKVIFKYELTNFKLTDQTTDAMDKHCSNSAKGQHIHLILNNEPYLAKYETDFSITLKEGNYVALSFLSRSYHESLKHKRAYVLRQFKVGDVNSQWKSSDLKKPLLFYSRPKGEYVGEDAKKVLLDFYIVNCKLSPKGHKVKATINGTEFILTDWQAYAMEGLPMGETIIKLELLDKDNVLVVSDFNSTTRKITLK
jgi:hypothetical protein